jgi:hypothetical protein
MRLSEWEKAEKVLIRIKVAIPVEGAPKPGEVVEAVRVKSTYWTGKTMEWWVKGKSLKPIGFLVEEAEEVHDG